MDEDDEPGLLGAESDWYSGLPTPVTPRNGPFRHVLEVEMVAGVWGEFVRGEDTNHNFRLDPNENDALRSLPEDEPDGELETGWGGRLTVHSVDGGATASGQPRLYLRRTEPEVLADQCRIDIAQAELLVAYGKVDGNELEQLLTVPLTSINANGQIADESASPDVEPLTNAQLVSVLAETTMLPLYERIPGRLNLNTASPDLIRDLLEAIGLPDALADEIIYMRDSRAEGIASLVDLYQIQTMTPDLLYTLSQLFTTTSNVFTVSVRGRSTVSAMEIEIIAVVDRSSVPVRILEYREQ
jgi:hypothetical protein